MPFLWTDYRIRLLTRLWDEKGPDGKPAHSTIAMGEEIGCGKNAVIGKARRLKLTPRPHVGLAWNGTKKNGKPAPIGRPRGGRSTVGGDTLSILLPEVVIPKTRTTHVGAHVSVDGRREALQGVTLSGVRVRPATAAIGCAKTCQWPLTDAKPWRFCDAPSLAGYSFCEAHRDQAYIVHAREPIAHPVGF